jgi:crossover junction endodeoxyribonuclease RusA
MTGPLEVSVWVFPPTRGKHDLDNILKALLDAMEHAGVYENDSQVSRLVVERGKVLKGGGVDVMIQPYNGTCT